MTHEIVPDTPCPHCERQNTTLRRSIEEDGFTKVSRICTACGGEWTHTWDRDWLADAKNRKLRAENERLRADLERLRTVYVLIASRQSGPVDSATCWYEDKIIGCYISREAAEGAAKLLMADWRINEYALVGKP